MGDSFGFFYLIVLVVAFYFLLIRPQQVRAKKMRELMEALSEGDRVITIGGLHGTVVSVDDSTVVLRVRDNSELEFEKASIAKIVVDIPPLGEDS
ncbi:MAG: preprotein translocase subunit YajC [Coriobacteriia bacterium]|nr:preprotein translocase subunit YajC [Coriobacteriia bacterium]